MVQNRSAVLNIEQTSESETELLLIFGRFLWRKRYQGSEYITNGALVISFASKASIKRSMNLNFANVRQESESN